MRLPKLKQLFEDLKAAPISEKDVDPKELAKGIKVEMEHTNDSEEAKTIALQHLAEPGNEHYYTDLEQIESGHDSQRDVSEQEDFIQNDDQLFGSDVNPFAKLESIGISDSSPMSEQDPSTSPGQNIHVPGIGMYSYDGLKQNLMGKLEDLVQRAQQDDFEGVADAQLKVMASIWMALRKHKQSEGV